MHVIEQSVQGSDEKVAQRPSGRVKKRGREQRVGRLKYNQQLLKQCLVEIKSVKDMQRVILRGLKGAGYFQFDVPLIQRVACVDQVDLDILDRVYTAGVAGVYPKVVAAELSEYKLKHYNVSRRIERMNRRLERETDEKLFEKRGWKWALTRFAFDIWGENEKP